MRRVLFVPDCHHPYVDPNAWKLMLRAARAFEPDHIVVLGDFGDCAKVSHHSKDPSRLASFQDEVDNVNDRLDELEAIKPSSLDFVEGNHEYWLPRYLADKAPELYTLRALTIPSLYNLQARGWRYTPYRHHVKVGKIFITHEAGNAGADAHRKAQATFADNIIIGHTHRIGYTVVGNAKGEPHVGAMFGWLGDVTKIDYAHRIQALRDWSLGFGVGFAEDNGVTHLAPVPIIKDRCVVAGELVKL